MRKLALASALVLALVAAAPAEHAAAAPRDGSVSIAFYSVQFTSILGGTVSGTGYVSGSLQNGTIGDLRGTAYLPLRDQRLSLAPVGTLALTRQEFTTFWHRWHCDMFGCWSTTGTATFEREYAQGPVEIRLGTMRGDGTLSIGTVPTCIADCPPPGASYWLPYGGHTSVYQAAVLGSHDAGFVTLFGPAPDIR